MKFLVRIIILIFGDSGSLIASVEELLGDYSEIAIAHVGSNKEVKDLMVISGNGFSIEKLRKQALGHAITHPSISRREHTCLLLKGPKVKGIASQKVIWCRSEFQRIEGYGDLQLIDLRIFRLSQLHAPTNSE
jgi:hypothetical protein